MPISPENDNQTEFFCICFEEAFSCVTECVHYSATGEISSSGTGEPSLARSKPSER